jgi:phosphopantothenoylcysteine decarboxylase/phosphopantothenate--cysteine ligase
MGRELARAALRRGAAVTVVCGPCEVPPPAGAVVVPVVTAAQMRRETLRRVSTARVLIGAAAVADWRFSSFSRHKLKRGRSALRLTLVPNPDIIKEAAARRGAGCVAVGFALETRGGPRAAREKLLAKGLDLVVANGPASVGAERSRFDIVSRAGTRRLGVVSKRRAAGLILDAAAGVLGG